MERKITKIAPHKNLKIKRKRTAAYARVSSGKDAMLHSLSAQVSYYSKMIQSRPDWQYVGVYADEAATGTKDNRNEFQRMISDCKAGNIDMIITKSISRFARNTVTLLETVRHLKELNVDVYFEEQNIHSMSGDGELCLLSSLLLHRRKVYRYRKTANGEFAMNLNVEYLQYARCLDMIRRAESLK